MGTVRFPLRVVMVVLGLSLAGAGSTLAQMQVFLAEQQALQVALGDAERVHTLSMRIDEATRSGIERASGVPLNLGWTRCYQGVSAGRVIAYACIDNMIGKERPITYIVRIDHPTGRIGLLEVMEYREAIGGEVNAPVFREQFNGKGASDPVRLLEDIRNLAGATLSSRGLTNGARKILHLYETFLRRLPPQ